MREYQVSTEKWLPSRHLLKPLDLIESRPGFFEYRCALFDLRTVFSNGSDFDRSCSETTVVSNAPLPGFPLFRILGDSEGETPGCWLSPIEDEHLTLLSPF
jgi:hypothetical protein